MPLSSAVDLVPGRLEHVEVGVGSDSLERHQRRRAVAANVDYSRAFVDVSFLAGPWRSAKASKLEQPFYRALCRPAARETWRPCPSIPAARLRGVVMPQARRWRDLRCLASRRASAGEARPTKPTPLTRPGLGRSAPRGTASTAAPSATRRNGRGASGLAPATRRTAGAARRRVAARAATNHPRAPGVRRAPGAPRRAAGRPPRSPAAAPPPTHFRRLKLRPQPLTVRARTSSTLPAGTPPTDPLRALKNLKGLRVRSHRTDSCKTKPR